MPESEQQESCGYFLGWSHQPVFFLKHQTLGCFLFHYFFLMLLRNLLRCVALAFSLGLLVLL